MVLVLADQLEAACVDRCEQEGSSRQAVRQCAGRVTLAQYARRGKQSFRCSFDIPE